MWFPWQLGLEWVMADHLHRLYTPTTLMTQPVVMILCQAMITTADCSISRTANCIAIRSFPRQCAYVLWRLLYTHWHKRLLACKYDQTHMHQHTFKYTYTSILSNTHTIKYTAKGKLRWNALLLKTLLNLSHKSTCINSTGVSSIGACPYHIFL